ncbi:hypothetical protein [Paenibacillus daejeonensis]|uniref:hypothetical protein n=1 Tax=Paenibacillus daejeonensis TaxID=135193 RepID=UPI00037C05E4|nr:hypothetical protein [Paenibacillus daejeonensis]
MRTKRWIIAGLVLLVTGCGSSAQEEAPPDAMAADEGCIVRIDDTSKKICYGMKMSEVEAIAGVGEESDRMMAGHEYAGGLKIGYRGDKAVFLTLQGDEVAYTTARGPGVGTAKEEMKSQYGQQYAIDEAAPNLDYFYDMESKTPLGVDTLMKQKTPEAMEQTLVVSAVFDSDGKAKNVMLMDRRMAVYFN